MSIRTVFIRIQVHSHNATFIQMSIMKKGLCKMRDLYKKQKENVSFSLKNFTGNILLYTHKPIYLQKAGKYIDDV